MLNLGVDQTVYSMVSKALYLYKMMFTRGITIYGVRETLLEFVGVCWSLLESVGVCVLHNLRLMCVMSRDRGALVLFQINYHKLGTGVVYHQLGIASVGTVLHINRLHTRYCSPLLSHSIK